MKSFDKLADYDLNGIKLLTDYSYDDALVGIKEDKRAIYDYDKMVRWLVEEEGFEETDSEEWINYNTLRALDYLGSDSPIIMHALA
ncbi:hypothetical protein [Clostridium sp. KNHs205]|uniref:hypothetical protein n=1 Tax=Clostridium sp. KNHs205 TaxID=1449050 RepID=UPI00051BA77C|nr:hypothetical protein [Clostridium sp. KNHs205]